MASKARGRTGFFADMHRAMRRNRLKAAQVRLECWGHGYEIIIPISTSRSSKKHRAVGAGFEVLVKGMGLGVGFAQFPWRGRWKGVVAYREGHGREFRGPGHGYAVRVPGASSALRCRWKGVIVHRIGPLGRVWGWGVRFELYL